MTFGSVLGEGESLQELESFLEKRGVSRDAIKKQLMKLDKAALPGHALPQGAETQPLQSQVAALEEEMVQERRHGPRVSHTGRSFLVMLTSLSAQRLESLSNLVRDCTLKAATIGESISELEVFKALVCKSLLSVGEYTTRGGVTVLYGDKGYMLHKGSNVAKKLYPWIQKEMRDSQYYGCTVAYKESNVYNIKMKPRGNKTDAMPLSEESDNRSSGGCRPGPNL